MFDKKNIVRQFAKYCSKCDGQCCKRGVFTVFGWEAKNLSKEYENFHKCHVSDIRGESKDITINGLCQFSTGNGCKLRVGLRPTDCLTYPFYPKKVEGTTNGFQIDSFVIDKMCLFSEEIAKDNELLLSVQKYWESMNKKVSGQDITDWIGNEGNWSDWYNNAIEVKPQKK